MLCINKTDTKNQTVNMNLYGPNENSAHRMIELVFLPTHCKQDEDCVNSDLDLIKEKIGPPNFLMIKNHQRVDYGQFGINSIVNESVIYNQQWSTLEPTFTEARLYLALFKD